METSHQCLFEIIFQKLSVPAIILKADAPRYTVLSFNEAQKLLICNAGASMAGESIFDFFKSELIAPKVIERFKTGLDQAINSNRPVKVSSFRFNSLAASNNNWWEIEIVPIGNADSDAKQILLNILNIAHRLIDGEGQRREQLLNEELAATNEELITLNEELTHSQESLQYLNIELEERVALRTKALEESESRFRNMMETIPQMAWTNNPHGEINFYNQQWHNYTGLLLEQTNLTDWKWYEYDPKGYEHTQPKGWHKIVHPDDLENTLNSYQQIIRSGLAGEFETRFKQTNNGYRWHLNRLVPFTDSKGDITLWVGTATDIENLKVLQQQKDDFISIASHELKTPITTLKASLQIMKRMKDKSPSDTFGHLVDKANHSMQRVSILIEDLLNASKFSHGQMQLHKKIFPFHEQVNECIQQINETASSKIVINGDNKINVYADPERVGQVLTNFISNAQKYAPQSKEIVVDIHKNEKVVKVSVSDQGQGIPPDKLPFLFDRYYRVETSCVQFSGLGLGLYICSEIIKNHKGRIGVNSELGKGSTFWFELPLA